MGIKQFAFKSWELAKKHSGVIMTTAACAGVTGTAITFAKAGMKVARKLPAIKNDKEEVKLYLSAFTLPATIALLTMTDIIALNIVSEKKIQKLTVAAAGALANLKAYRDTNIEVNGQEADTKVLEVMEARMLDGDYGISYQDCFMSFCDDIDYASYPKELFFEPISGMHFWSTMPAFLDARFHLNRNFNLRGFASHEEFLSLLGVGPETDPYPSEEDTLGWDCEYLADMTGQYVIDIMLEPDTYEGHRCHRISYGLEPVTNYDGNCM